MFSDGKEETTSGTSGRKAHIHVTAAPVSVGLWRMEELPIIVLIPDCYNYRGRPLSYALLIINLKVAT